MPTPQQRLDDLIALVAKLRGEVEAYRVKHDYHCQRVSHIDPHEDWWTFAHHKQACFDAQVEMEALNTRVAKHAAKLEALMGEMM